MEELSPKPQKGMLLVADPFLQDDNFRRSVILLTEYNEEGVVGFVLNNPTGVLVGDAVEELSELAMPLYTGGPVELHSLNFVHRRPDLIPGGYEVGDKLFFGGDFEELQRLIDAGGISEHDFRFFRGYAGWSKAMLDRELRQKSWFVVDTRADYIFGGDHESLWKSVIKDMGGEYALLVNAPLHPSLN